VHLLLSSVECRAARWKDAASFVKKTEARRNLAASQEQTGYILSLNLVNGDLMPAMKILQVECFDIDSKHPDRWRRVVLCRTAVRGEGTKTF